MDIRHSRFFSSLGLHSKILKFAKLVVDCDEIFKIFEQAMDAKKLKIFQFFFAAWINLEKVSKIYASYKKFSLL